MHIILKTNGQSERTIESLEDLLKTCVFDHLRNLNEMLTIVEFTYNNSYHNNIGMTPYEALYRKKCITPLCWYQDGEVIFVRLELLQHTIGIYEWCDACESIFIPLKGVKCKIINLPWSLKKSRIIKILGILCKFGWIKFIILIFFYWKKE